MLVTAHTMKRRRISEAVLKRVGSNALWRCCGCDELLTSTFELDHRVPLHLGGSDDEDNLQPICVSCHAEKTQRERIAAMHTRREAVADARRRNEVLLLTLKKDPVPDTALVVAERPRRTKSRPVPLLTLEQSTHAFVRNPFLHFAFAPPRGRRPLGSAVSAIEPDSSLE